MTTFQARIIAPTGAPLESGSVNFRFTILDTVGTCILYVEDYANVNMGGSQGIATFGLGSGVKVYPATAVLMADVFNNSAPSFPCQAGGIYAPGTTDRRQVVMQFNDGSGWQTIPQLAINSVFYSNYANRAENLGNYPAQNYLRPATLPVCTGSQALSFDGATFSCIAAGAAAGVTSVTGTSPVVITGGTSTPVVSMAKATGSVSGYLSSADWTAFSTKASAFLTSGQIYLGNASNDATGAVLSGDATIANSGVLTLANSGVGAGSYGSSSTIPFLTIDSKGRVTSASSAAYQDASGAAKGIVRIGSNLTIAAGVLSMQSSDITAALGYTPMSGTGSAFVNNGNAFSADSTLGNTSNFSLSLITNNINRVTILNNGKVGIGTTTPGSTLDVSGTIGVSDGTTSLPSIRFSGQTDTGFLRHTANSATSIGVATGGLTKFIFDINGFYSTSARGPWLNPSSGSAAFPAFTFNSDTASGLYQASASSLGLSVAGTSRLNIDSVGNVGIGTTNSSASLTIGDGVANDGALVAKGYGVVGTNGQTLATSGAGTRLIWYPKKAAFRTGGVDGTQWDDVNIGLYSVAMGDRPKASGDDAVALGGLVTASNTSSVAIGWNNSSSGSYSSALGAGSQATGSGSNAYGYSVLSSGARATSLGSFTTAGNGIAGSGKGDNSMAIGLGDFSAMTYPRVTGTGSMGIFLGSTLTATDVTANNVMSVMGGSVGIGTTTPSSPLSVVGDVNITGTYRVNGVPLSAGGGSVTNVSSANADIAVATGSTTPVLTLNSGTGNNQIVKLTAAGKYPAVDGSLITNLSFSSFGTSTLPIANGGTNSSTPLNNNRLITSVGGQIVEAAAMTDGQIVVGKSANAPQIVTMSGDTTVTNTGVVTVGKIGGTLVTGVGLANNNILQNNSGSSIAGNNMLISNGTATGVTSLVSPASGVLTSTGTVPSWSTSLPTTMGGTGLTNYTVGDLLYASGTTTIAKLPAATTGYVLTSNGTGTPPTWQASAAAGGALSALTAATATNTIDSTNFAQTWNWSTATTQNPMTMTGNALTTGSLLNITSSNGTLNSTNGLLNVANTGASTTGLVARIQSNSTTGSGLTVLANSNVGIGTTTPLAKLDVYGAINISGLNALRFPSSETAAGGTIAIGPSALSGQTASAAYYNTAIG